MEDLKIKLMHEDAELPVYATDGSGGLDLQVMVENMRCCENLVPGHVMKFKTGVAIEMPSFEYVGLLVLRSSAIDRGIRIVNGIQIIDADYRGEIKVPLYTDRDTGAKIEHAERLAQLVIIPRPVFNIIQAQELGETKRGANGFGHTGRH